VTANDGLPANREAEESVLGAMLVAKGAIPPVMGELQREDFYLERHKPIFDAIRSLAERGAGVDTLTVSAELEQHGRLEDAGGKPYVYQLAAAVPAAGHVVDYVQLIRDKADLREWKRLGHDLAVLPDCNGSLEPLLERHDRLRGKARGRRGAQSRVADLSRVRPIRWAWSGRLPLGYLSLLVGAEGIGKGTLQAWLVSRLTRGELPGDLEGERARVLIVGDEDSFESVVVPRLYAAGADLELVETLCDDEEVLDVHRDAAKLRELVVRKDFRVVVLDSLLDTLEVGLDDGKPKPVRDALRPLRRVVRDLDACVLGLMHPTKGAKPTFRDLLSGSHQFNASSRSSLLLGQHPEDEGRLVLVRGKGNLSAPPPSFEFAIEGRDLELNGHAFSSPIVVDGVEGELRIEDLVKPERAAPVVDALLEEIDGIGTGEIQSRSEIAEAVGKDGADRSVERALKRLEDQARWEKVDRGKWRKLFGIGTPKGDANAKSLSGPNGAAATPEQEREAERLRLKFEGDTDAR
jgi:hypothetical protein